MVVKSKRCIKVQLHTFTSHLNKHEGVLLPVLPLDVSHEEQKGMIFHLAYCPWVHMYMDAHTHTHTLTLLGEAMRQTEMLELREKEERGVTGGWWRKG